MVSCRCSSRDDHWSIINNQSIPIGGTKKNDWHCIRQELKNYQALDMLRSIIISKSMCEMRRDSRISMGLKESHSLRMERWTYLFNNCYTWNLHASSFLFFRRNNSLLGNKHSLLTRIFSLPLSLSRPTIKRISSQEREREKKESINYFLLRSSNWLTWCRQMYINSSTDHA